MSRTIWYIVLLTVLLGLVIGALLFGKLTSLSPAEQERQRIENRELEERLELERPMVFFWSWAWRVVIVLGGLGALGVALVWGVRMALTIAPNRKGIFPLLLGRVGKAWVIHDPNRALAGTNLIPVGPDKTPHFIPALPEGLEREQVQITSQAQMVQGVAAAANGEENRGRIGALTDVVLGQSNKLSRPHPKPQRSPWQTSHIKQLLLESGALQEEDYDL
jgi:hypothetical protein